MNGEFIAIVLVAFLCSFGVCRKLLLKESKKGIIITIAICISLMLLSIIINYRRVKYPYINENIFSIFKYLITYLIPIIICIIYYLIKKDNKYIRGLFIILMSVFSLIVVVQFFICISIYPLFESRTINIDNYLKFDSNLYNTSFMPKDLSSYEVKEYNYRYRHSVSDIRYDVYLEVKANEDEYQQIYNDISNNGRSVMKTDKEYFLVGEGNGAFNYERDLKLVIFDKSDYSIIYQRSYDKHDNKELLYKMDENTYQLLYRSMYSKKESKDDIDE